MPASAPLVTEYLIFFPAVDTPHGRVPAFYARETCAAHRAFALEAGGVDVSDDAAAWAAYDREVRSYDASLL